MRPWIERNLDFLLVLHTWIVVILVGFAIKP